MSNANKSYRVRACDPTGNMGVQVYVLSGRNAERDLKHSIEYYDTWGWTYTVTEVA